MGNHKHKQNVLIIGSGIAGLYFTVKAFSYYKKAQRRAEIEIHLLIQISLDGFYEQLIFHSIYFYLHK